jgi:hypothetical protein
MSVVRKKLEKKVCGSGESGLHVKQSESHSLTTSRVVLAMYDVIKTSHVDSDAKKVDKSRSLVRMVAEKSPS